MVLDITSFEQQIPEMLTKISAALRNGYSLKQSLELVRDQMSTPLAWEAAIALAEIGSGVTFADALENWRKRVPSEDLNLIVATFNYQRTVGTNLADHLDFLKEVLAHRLR